MDCDGTDCEGCAVCDTLIMSSDGTWEPTWLPGLVVGRCVFCQRSGALAYYTALGSPVGLCCARD